MSEQQKEVTEKPTEQKTEQTTQPTQPTEEQKQPPVEETKVEKKKKKKKKKDKKTDQPKTTEVETKESFTKEEESEYRNMIKQLKEEEERIKQEEMKKKHHFWDTQPVLKLSDEATKVGPIETKTLDEVPKEPYPLHPAFEWYEFDVNSDEEMQQIFELLEQNYVEDDEAMFRFAYPIEFLRWALTPPNWRRDWHLAVRVKENKKFVGLITAIPMKMDIRRGKTYSIQMVEINFLCVHKKLRDKRLAPQLIREITRRVNLTDCWQAVYTAGRLLPSPVATTRYWHRSLNPAKLISIGFSRVHRKFLSFSNPVKMTERLYKLPTNYQIRGFREMRESDCKAVYPLLRNYMKKFPFAPQFTREEFAHWFIPREGVINSFVVEDPETQKITDFISFYTLPSTIIGNNKYKLLKAAYLYYYATTKTPFVDLMRDALIAAKQRDFDVFNCLNILENEQAFKELKFGIGDGNLYYYLYNWECPAFEPREVGLVML